MRLIPNWFFTLLTFPGIITHEIAHNLACRALGVKVKKTVIFSLKGLFSGELGYVIHETPRSLIKQLIISNSPIVLNSVFALLMFVFSGLMLKSGLDSRVIIPLWLGFSAGIHSSPSKGDARTVLEVAKKRSIIFFIILYPYYLLIRLRLFLSKFGLDLAYTFILAYLSLPLTGLDFEKILNTLF